MELSSRCTRLLQPGEERLRDVSNPFILSTKWKDMGQPAISETKTEKVLDLARKRGIITGRDLEEHDLPRRYLSRLHQRGELDRVGRGLYALPDREITEHHDLALVARRLPDAVVCLLSALRFYDLTTQAPFEVWVALPTEAWEPAKDAVPLRTVRLSGEALTAGMGMVGSGMAELRYEVHKDGSSGAA